MQAPLSLYYNLIFASMRVENRSMLKRFLEKRVDEDWLHTNFPCMMACPAHTNAGRYVGLIAEGRFEEAYKYARGPNPLASICGRVCAHPCETACRRGQIDKPISIRALKRFLTERYGPESKHPIDVNAGAVKEKLPFKVAVVGGGPVGLSAAHDLALMGYSVTIFEAAPVAGGMLYLGIPEYRLPRDVVEAQVREILADRRHHAEARASRGHGIFRLPTCGNATSTPSCWRLVRTAAAI